MPVAQADAPDQIDDTLLGLVRVADAAMAQRRGQDVAHGLARVERRVRVLEDDLRQPVELDLLRFLRQALPVAGHQHLPAACQALALKVDLPGGRQVQAGQQAAERGLAAAALAHQPERLARVDRQFGALHSSHHLGAPPGERLHQEAGPDVEVLLQAARLDHGLDGAGGGGRLCGGGFQLAHAAPPSTSAARTTLSQVQSGSRWNCTCARQRAI